MLGISFNGVTSATMGVYWQSSNRTLLPARRTVKYQIPGKDGYYEADTDTYDNRQITGTISFLGTDRTYSALRTKARLVAQWLSGSGLLIFDDEPAKAYTAKVVDAVNIDLLARAGSCSVTFDCAPFAEALTYSEQQTANASLPHTETVEVAGTQNTPCIIKITATSAITGDLTITRKVVV